MASRRGTGIIVRGWGREKLRKIRRNKHLNMVWARWSFLHSEGVYAWKDLGSLRAVEAE